MQASVARSICPGCGAEFAPSMPDQITCDNCAGLAEPEQPASPLAGSVVGGFKLVHPLGAGRFSTSWLAEPEGGGGVVLKLLRAYAPDSTTVQRFLDEARRVASARFVDHPAVARVVDAGVHLSGSLFLVYESGGESTVADELRGRGRLPASRALELCAQICEGLTALHAAGLTHRNLKPANVGLAREEDGRETAVLLDAFTGHLLGHAGLRETGLLPLSTVAYLSPEEAAGEVPDGRADLYAAGVLLYQLISGRLPIVGSTVEDLIEAHRRQRALRLRDAGRRVVPELEAVVARLLAKKPEERFREGGEAARALRKVIPIADQAPAAGAADEELDDPLHVPGSDPGLLELLEPEVHPPPPAQRVDPGLEQAMLGRVQQEHRPVPRAAPAGARPAWLTPGRAVAATLGLVAVVAVVLVLALREEKPARKARAKQPSATAKAEPRPAARPASPPPPPEEKAPEPAPPTHLAEAKAEAAPEAARPPKALRQALAKPAERPAPKPKAAEKPAKKVASASLAPPPAAASQPLAAPPAPAPADDAPPPVAAALGRVQRDLSQGKAEPAIQTLQALLSRSDLSKPVQGRATRLMAEAEAKKGDKKAAVDWYRKYLRLADDPAERARVVKVIQELSR